MRYYLVIRHGSNASNQPGCGRMPVALVEAPTASAAIDLVEPQVTLYQGQYLSAVAESRATAEDLRWIREELAVRGLPGEGVLS